MKISKIEINQLYGIFTHTITMRLDEHVTIIHGPNGFGKTAILRLVHGVLRSKFLDVASMPFGSFVMYFDNGSSLTVKRVEDVVEPRVEKPRFYARLEFTFSKPNDTTLQFSKHPSTELDQLGVHLGMIQQMIPDLIQVAQRQWQHGGTGEILDLPEVLARYGDFLPMLTASQQPREPGWFLELQRGLPVRLIDTQRLLTTSRPIPHHGYRGLRGLTVIEDAQNLLQAINAKLAEYGSLSQSLDRSFPVRLVTQTYSNVFSSEELTTKLKDLEQKRTALVKDGLLDAEQGPQVEALDKIDSAKKPVLSVYVEDTKAKLEVFDDLASKIGLFKEIISGRFLYKEMIIDRKAGITFKTKQGKALALADLSSGEQHELVLFYDLLFQVQPNSLILIDEPEISLHVAWQEQFLQDIQRITKLRNFDVLLATHSPQIILDRWDLTEKLSGPQ